MKTFRQFVEEKKDDDEVNISQIVSQAKKGVDIKKDKAARLVIAKTLAKAYFGEMNKH